MDEESEKETQGAEESDKEETAESTEKVKKEKEADEEELKEADEEIHDEEETPSSEEEIKHLPPEEVDEEIVEERFYTIPLGKAWIAPPKKRAPRAIKIVEKFVKRHMKLRSREELTEEEANRLIISNEVNERIWNRGIQKPPRKVRVRAARNKDGDIIVYLAEGD